MLPIWLAYAVMVVAIAVQGIALILLGRYFRLHSSQVKEVSQSLAAHLNIVEQQERLNSERFRVIVRSLDELLALTRSRPHYLMGPPPPPPNETSVQTQTDTLDELVRGRSNQPQSWAEIKSLAKERKPQ